MFSGPKLKIERANRHINELNSALVAFLKTDFYKLHINTELAGQNVLTLDAKPLPNDIPLMLGDAIHNLRAALDIMACDIVTHAGGTPSKYTYFPVRDTRQELVAIINGGEIKIAGQDICDLIVDVVKPYKGGNDPLWSLHQIDIMDKHRLLIPTVNITQITGVCAHDDNHNTFTNMTLGVDAGGRLQAISTSARMHITNYGYPSFGIFFPKGGALEGQPLILTLYQLSQVVSGVIQTIEKALFTKG
jgi:hypothetical protein